MFNLFSKKIIPESLIAYRSRIPDSIGVRIRESEDGGYWVEVKNLPGCITQAENGQELFEMVNDAVFTYFDIPKEYIPFMPSFLPPEETRKRFDIEVPPKFLKDDLVMQKT